MSITSLTTLQFKNLKNSLHQELEKSLQLLDAKDNLYAFSFRQGERAVFKINAKELVHSFTQFGEFIEQDEIQFKQSIESFISKTTFYSESLPETASQKVELYYCNDYYLRELSAEFTNELVEVYRRILSYYQETYDINPQQSEAYYAEEYFQLMFRAKNKYSNFHFYSTNLPEEVEFFPPKEEAQYDPKGKVLPQAIRFSLAELFFEAGSLLTPLSPERNAGRLQNLIRNFQWLSEEKGNVRVKDAFNSRLVDPRFKGIFSEEFAISMTALTLRKHFGFKRLVSAVEFDDNKKSKLTDILATRFEAEENKHALVACRGSLKRRIRGERRNRARFQSQHTRLYLDDQPTDFLPMSSFMSVFHDYQKNNTELSLEALEPKEAQFSLAIEQVSAWRKVYTKLLRFLGFEASALSVYRTQKTNFLKATQAKDFQQNGFSVIKDMGFAYVIIRNEVLEVLQKGLHTEHMQQLEYALQTDEEYPENMFVGGPGIGIYFK